MTTTQSQSHYWQCSKCRLRIRKDRLFMFVGMEGHIDMKGTRACTRCQTAHAVADIYEGKFNAQNLDPVHDEESPPPSLIWLMFSPIWGALMGLLLTLVPLYIIHSIFGIEGFWTENPIELVIAIIG